MRNCLKIKKSQKESYKPVAVAVRLGSTPYVVTCNILCYIVRGEFHARKSETKR